VASAGDDEGGVDHPLGEKRERKRREMEEEAGGGLSFSLVAPNGLARLSRTVYSGMTEGQVAHGEWGISHVTAVGATKSRQMAWRD
jgi:hypothetical protein